MRTDAGRNADAERIPGATPLMRGGRPTAARREYRLCLACGERRALFFYRGVVKADRDHNLCFQCYRAEVNRLRARRLGALASGSTVANPRPRPSRVVADRAALLADIAARRRRAQIIARHALDARAAERADAALAS